MARNPQHPGALHLYIHLVEATDTPEKAEKAADTLLTLMPAAGHMVHMPAHIYQRVGRYADAIESRTSWPSPPTRTTSPSAARRACIRPATTRTTSTSSGLRPRSTGRARLAIDAARNLASKIDDETLKAAPLHGRFPHRPSTSR